MTDKKEKPEIFEYDDYRQFLKDYYEFSKQARRGFSYRRFSKDAGFSSPNFIKLVIEGQRNLTGKSVSKIAEAIKLSKDRAEYLDALVSFNQAETYEEKSKSFERMSKFKKFREVQGLAKEQFEFYSRWYYPAIRELVTLNDFDEDPAWIAQRIFPRLTEREVEEAVATLLRLGLIERNKKGRLVQSDALLGSGAEVKSVAVVKFHRQMLENASKSIDGVPSSERDLSSVTLGVQRDQMPKIKKMIQNFREELMAEIAGANSETEEVYQLNLQLFPLSFDEQKTKEQEQ